MDNRILDTLKVIQESYGDGVFYNITTVKNLMNDLAPNMRKERIQISNFLEIGGYFQLKYAEEQYPVVRTRLTTDFMDTYAVDEKVAVWVINIFSELLGYNITDEGAIYGVEERPKRPVARVDVQKSPYIGEKRQALMTVPRPKFNLGETKLAYTNWQFARRISADLHSVAVLKNGQVAAAGINSDGQCFTNTYDWRDIVAVSAGSCYTVGLRTDGTVVGTGRNDFGQRNFNYWSDIIGVSAGARHTIGLKSNGSLIATGFNRNGECNVNHWRNIEAVIAGQDCTFAIKKDGHVLVSGNNNSGDLQVSHLENVADIAYAAPGRILALLKNGCIARVGRENHMRRSFAHFKNVKQISAAPDYFAGLMEDGTVKLLAYFWQSNGAEAAVSSWRNIVAIAAGRFHIIGWKSDGTMVGEMLHPDIKKNKGQINVGKWEM